MFIDCSVANRIFNDVLLTAMNVISLFTALFEFRLVTKFKDHLLRVDLT